MSTEPREDMRCQCTGELVCTCHGLRANTFLDAGGAEHAGTDWLNLGVSTSHPSPWDPPKVPAAIRNTVDVTGKPLDVSEPSFTAAAAAAPPPPLPAAGVQTWEMDVASQRDALLEENGLLRAYIASLIAERDAALRLACDTGDR